MSCCSANGTVPANPVDWVTDLSLKNPVECMEYVDPMYTNTDQVNVRPILIHTTSILI